MPRRIITARDGDHAVSLPMAETIIRTLAVDAAKGKAHAQRLFIDTLSTIEREDKELREAVLKEAIEYKRDWECEFERRKKLGITDAPMPPLHPDRIKIDPQDDNVYVVAPRTEEEKVNEDRWYAPKPV